MSSPKNREQMLAPRGDSSPLDDWDSTPAVTRDGRLRLEMRRRSDGAEITLEVGQANAGADALMATDLGDVSYSRTEGIDGREAAEVVRGFGRALADGGMTQVSAALPHLLIGPDGRPSGAVATRMLATVIEENIPLLAGPDVDVLDAPLAVGEALLFDPVGLSELLAPELVIDGEPLQGFTLRTIAYPSVVAGAEQPFDVCVLEFERDAKLHRIRIGVRGAFESPFGRTPNFEIYVEPDRSAHGELVPPETGGLASLVVALVAAKDDAAMQVAPPRDEAQVRAYTLPAYRKPESAEPEREEAEPKKKSRAGGSLNLAIDAECNQACAFCSVKWVLEPEDGGEDRLTRALRDIRRAHEDGVSVVRLNGIDPLNFSRVLDVVREVRDLGFERLDVYTTARRFAHRDFTEAFAEVAPRNLSISVPVYGTTAEVHDAVTGAPGAHADIMAAIANLDAVLPRADLRISTVIVKDNVHQFADLARYAKGRGAKFDPHMPYPMRESARDPYTQAVVRESEITEIVLGDPQADAPLHSALASAVPHPCVLWHARSPGQRIALRRVAAGDGPRYLDGTEYADPEFVHGGGQDSADGVFSPRLIPCPRRRGCALAGDCPAEFIAQYVEVYGMDEFQPVSWPELVRNFALSGLVGTFTGLGGEAKGSRGPLVTAIAAAVALAIIVVVLLLR